MIKIAIYGQIDSDTKFVYTYPKHNSACPTQEDEWLRCITDPRSARDFGEKDVFALWKSDCGNYYAIIFPNKSDFRNGRMMVTIHTEKNIVTDGAAVVSALREIKDIFEKDSSNINDTSVGAFSLSLEKKLAKDESNYNTGSSGPLNPQAYRTFGDENELREIMRFPNQSEYKSFKWVLIVPTSCMESASQNIQNYKKIEGRIKRTYTIHKPLPEGVSVTKDSYNDTERVIVTYTKKGYASQEESFLADGKNNKCAEYKDSEIYIKSAEAAGIKLKREIQIDVTNSENGQTLSSARVTGLNCTCEKDRKSPNNKNNKYVFSEDLPEYKVRVECTGYNPKEITLREGDFNDGKVPVRLTHKPTPIKIKIKKDGKSNGDVLVQPGEGLYAVFQKYKDDELYAVLQKYKDDEIVLCISTKSAENAVDDDRGNDSDNDKGFLKKVKQTLRSPWMKYLLIALGGIFILYMGYAVYPYLFEQKTSTESQDTDTVEEQDTASGTACTYTGPTEQARDTVNDMEVLKYMKDNDVWKRSEMERFASSSEYVDIIDLIHNGQIDEAIGHYYTKQTMYSCNGYWSTFVKTVKELKNEGNYETSIKPKIVDEMKNKATDEVVNLRELASAIVVIKDTWVQKSNATVDEGYL